MKRNDNTSMFLMERDENRETTSFVPVIARLDRLDRVLQLLEEKHYNSLSAVRDFCASEISNKECMTLSSALDEVQRKGTLIARLTQLENRVFQDGKLVAQALCRKSTVPLPKPNLLYSCSILCSDLQLSLDMDECTTCSSTALKDSSEISTPGIHADVKFDKQRMQDPLITNTQEASSVDSSVRDIKARRKKKTKNKWQDLFRLRC